MKTCSLCSVKHYAKGFCQQHYLRAHRHGSPLLGNPLAGLSDRQRLWTRVLITESCWLWTGGKTTAGYGSAQVGGTRVYPHRYVFQLLVGPIPVGMELDHLCYVRHCCRPDHLEIVTGTENKQRAWQRRKAVA